MPNFEVLDEPIPTGIQITIDRVKMKKWLEHWSLEMLIKNSKQDMEMAIQEALASPDRINTTESISGIGQVKKENK